MTFKRDCTFARRECFTYKRIPGTSNRAGIRGIIGSGKRNGKSDHADRMTVLGASKGAAIAIYVSHLLESDEVNYVIMAICHPDEVEYFRQNHIYLHGNILSIYDAGDEYAGSCRELFSMSEGKGISTQDEIVLDIGSGHGMLYKPMDDWITPVVKWLQKP